MLEKNEEITNNTIKILESRGYIVRKHNNGHIKIDDVNFWCTTEKIWDESNGYRGKGINNLLKYLKDKERDEARQIKNVLV
jgi:hypothetical protein